ncbi:MAG TPA: phosphatase PAP2 family protein [bacterium]|nr:phosphatase PAP2 family protein [bacterium]HPQ18416.1 phosphatase PAP2 family protein [bacterium]
MINKIDTFFNKLIDKIYSEKFSTLFKIITFFGTAFFCFPFYFIFYFINKKIFFALFTIEFFNYLIVIPIRMIVKRARPMSYTFNKIYHWWNKYSFPSIHATRCGMLFFFIYNYLRFYQLFFSILIIFIFSIIFSRLYLKYHFFSDLFFGFLLGLLNAICIYKFLFFS